MTKNEERHPPLSPDEERLLQLFRCLDKSGQHYTLIEISHKLMDRYRIDPTWKEEMKSPDLKDYDSRLFYIWPGDWPDRNYIDLDNTGDPGAWLHDAFPESLSYHILGSTAGDLETAEILAESYISTLRENGVDLPIDYAEETEEQMEEGIRQDFVSFISEWRRRAVSAIVSQAKQAHK